MAAERIERLTQWAARAMSRRRVAVLGAVATIGAIGARESVEGRGRTRPRVCRGLRGGIVATFDVDGERFRVWVTNPQTIEQILALRDGTSEASIPNGRLRRRAGRRRHNRPWHWHLDPEEIEMAEATIELCDGRPSFIEENRDEFIAQVGRYCPWLARLEGVLDCRSSD
jgi:hypothetical protein